MDDNNPENEPISKNELTLDDLACYRGITWNCRVSPCEFWLYDRLVGGDRSAILYDMLEHWKETHPFEFSVVRGSRGLAPDAS
jgi:hypothetical protein